MAGAWGRRVDAGAGTPPKWRGEEIAHGAVASPLHTFCVALALWFFYTTMVFLHDDSFSTIFGDFFFRWCAGWRRVSDVPGSNHL
jgi:hypothetical protein